jgi:hypothetical protein
MLQGRPWPQHAVKFPPFFITQANILFVLLLHFDPEFLFESANFLLIIERFLAHGLLHLSYLCESLIPIILQLIILGLKFHLIGFTHTFKTVQHL